MGFDSDSPSGTSQPSPRDRILDAAERTFAEHGIEQASLRQITTAADVNIAAVNYYYGSKEQLVFAVLDRMAERINSRRHMLLDEAEARMQAGGKAITLEEVIDIFIEPYASPGTREYGHLLLKLILNSRTTPNEVTNQLLSKHFNPFAERIIRTLKQVVPNLDEADLAWRYFFMIGAVLLGVSDAGGVGRIQYVTREQVSPDNMDKLMQQLKAFLLGGFREAAGTRKT
ncbi:TetR/AcrR family transcriptional regulator [Nitratireductor basaltis]|uniref:TetR family transcription factor n=1 Tax=Nitratireductor basaltis TaxID=472175 RepID=A0A084UD57_9HYPH|nr:TetR/AcrR family transcriptional regulator [Nitratireductor basaltis]KFB10893.1 TetR family transcription factor [Nitratireductor basaltis]